MSLACHFTASEWALLSGGLRLKDSDERDPLRSMKARDLLQEDVCEQLLDALGPVIGSPTRAITASLLGKRLSFLATGACLYAMSVYDKGLQMSLDNTVIEYGHDEGLWTSSVSH
jgi:ferric iron reductase protein FhuF